MKTSNGHEIKLKKEITGGEYQDIQDALYNETEMRNEDDMKMKGTGLAKLRDKAIEIIVISVDGEKGNVLELVRNLPRKDYTEVIAKVNDVRDGMNEEKKTV